jgi:hypothetical protein
VECCKEGRRETSFLLAETTSAHHSKRHVAFPSIKSGHSAVKSSLAPSAIEEQLQAISLCMSQIEHNSG